MGETVKYTLDESKLPEAWYNVAADLPEPPAPVLHPGTGQPVGPDDLAPLFPMAVILQEVSTDERIPIPEEVHAVYRQWRPTPLFRARRLEQELDELPVGLGVLEEQDAQVGPRLAAERDHAEDLGSRTSPSQKSSTACTTLTNCSTSTGLVR